ncbi:MAG: hypothetical protein HQL99_03765 [Magnetococcales bacterium]|nr:hypothetical protein [Magnetococcales bacterium]
MSGCTVIRPNTRQSYAMGVKGIIFAEPTQDFGRLLQSLDPVTSVLVDICYGNLSFQGFKGSRFRGVDWPSLLRIAAIIGGTNPDLSGDMPFSKRHHASVCQKFGGRNPMDGVKTVFIHGLYGCSVLLDWYSQGLASCAEKKDVLAFQRSYDAMLIGMLRQIFRVSKRGISVWFTVPLKPGTSRLRQGACLVPDIDQPKLLQELTCLSDLIVSQTDVWRDGIAHTVLVTDPLNKWELPAKSAAAFGLAALEPPDLAELIRKVSAQSVPESECLEGFNPLDQAISMGCECLEGGFCNMA